MPSVNYCSMHSHESSPVKNLILDIARKERYPPIMSDRCFFSSYDGESIVREGVYHYLRQLKMTGFDTVFISKSNAISGSDLKKLAGYCIRIISRENRGYDFYSWKVGLEEYPQHREHAGFLLANDSVYGPLFDFSDTSLNWKIMMSISSA